MPRWWWNALGAPSTHFRPQTSHSFAIKPHRGAGWVTQLPQGRKLHRKRSREGTAKEIEGWSNTRGDSSVSKNTTLGMLFLRLLSARVNGVADSRGENRDRAAPETF